MRWSIKALEALYNSTNGPHNWTSANNWLTGQPCTSSWYGINCTDIEYHEMNQTATSVSVSVTSIHLTSNELLGTLPPTLGHLTALQSLDLSGNHLSGTLAEQLGGLTEDTAGYSGADITQLAREAAMGPLREHMRSSSKRRNPNEGPAAPPPPASDGGVALRPIEERVF